MPQKILQINFRFSVTPDEYSSAVMEMADDFAAVDGLKWKVWIMNEKRKEAGGIYLFKDQSSLDALLNGPLAAAVTSHPALACGAGSPDPALFFVVGVPPGAAKDGLRRM
jgi:hypothetical protein